MIMFGIPGIMIVSPITSIPTREPFKKPAAVGDQKTTGAMVT